MRRHPLLWLLVALMLAGSRADAANVQVRFTTVFGEFDVELCAELSDACPGVAPDTVANFLHYVDEGVYPQTTFVHRRGSGVGGSPPVIQSGGYWIGYDEQGYYYDVIPPFAPIALEIDPNLSNVRGSIAAARGPDVNSATSQWYVNLIDNTNLDGNYAVFGHVVAGLDVVDAIGDLQLYNVGAPFSELPLLDSYPGGGSVVPYLVYFFGIERVPEPHALAGSLAAVLALALRARRRRR